MRVCVFFVCDIYVCVCVCLSLCLYLLFVCVVYGVTRLGEDNLATCWPKACVKILSLSFPMTNNADILGAALTLTDIFTSIWNIVENIFEVSIYMIRVLPKKTRSIGLHF